MEQEIRVPFPVKGVVQRTSYQDDDAASTVMAVNVFVDDSSEARARGGSRVGLEKRFADNVGDIPAFLEIVSTLDTDGQTYQILVLGTTDNIFISDAQASTDVNGFTTYSETLGAVSGDLLIEDGTVLTTEGGDDIFLADFTNESVERGKAQAYQDKVVVAAGDVADDDLSYAGTEYSLTMTSGAFPGDWSAVNVDKYFAVVTDHATASVNRAYNIQTANGSTLALEGATASGSATVKIVPAHRIFDPTTSTLEPITLTGGTPPEDIDTMTVYRDRLVMTDGRVWYMSRQGDIGDWDYGADVGDAGRAIAATVSDAGQPGDPIIAMVAGGYDYLLFLAEDTTWVLRGDPTYDGQLYNLSRTEGCVDSEAWCYGHKGEIFFLSKHGLCVLPPDMGQPPVLLSQEPLARELRAVNRFSYYVTLAYDSQDQSVLIFIVPRGGGAGTHWRFDTETQSFWKMEFADNDHQPVEAVEFSGTPDRPSRVTMACRDGYVRQLSGTDDDGTAISSYVVLGPYPLSDIPSAEGIINSIVGSLDANSGDVTLELYVADTPEQATIDAQAGTSPDWSTTISSGRNVTLRPRRRGVSFCLRLESTNTWAFELLTVGVSKAGRKRY